MSEEKNLKKLFESKRIELYLRAEVRMLRDEIFQLRRERISYIYRLKRKIQKFKKKVKINTISEKHINIINETTIIVPVYGQINLFGDLVRDLKKVVENWPLVKILVVDDKYNDSSSIKLKNLCEDNINIRIIENEENLGYLKAVNNAFKYVDTKYIILLNSDVRIPDNWLPRMVKPFLDDSVALATCLATQSGGNLTLNNFTETNWREVDSLISGLESSNLDEACTAIGYCMALRVNALDGENIYDEAFSPAYGEDSDLHYRVKSKDWRSVVISNLLVHHIGGASYGESEESNLIKERSMNLFLNKWGSRFLVDEEEFLLHNPIDRVKNYLALEGVEPSKYDVIFISPSNNSEIGGINVLVQLANTLADTGLKVGFICLNYDPTHSVQNFTILNKESLKLIKEVRIVISSGLEVYEVLSNIEQKFEFKLINIIQGPEYMMDDRFFEKKIFEQIYLKSLYNIVVSPFLLKSMNHFEIPNLKSIVFGPDSRIFYDNFLIRDKNLLISCRNEKNKGSDLAISIIPILKNQGWKVFGYGDLENENHLSLFDKFYGRINRNELSDLMRKCKVSLDFSTYEGLGLQPIESSMCGCIPVISDRGGNQSLKELVPTDTLWVTTPSVIEIDEILKNIDKASEFSKIDVRRSNENILLKLDFSEGSKQLISLIESILD